MGVIKSTKWVIRLELHRISHLTVNLHILTKGRESYLPIHYESGGFLTTNQLIREVHKGKENDESDGKAGAVNKETGLKNIFSWRIFEGIELLESLWFQ